MRLLVIGPRIIGRRRDMKLQPEDKLIVILGILLLIALLIAAQTEKAVGF